MRPVILRATMIGLAAVAGSAGGLGGHGPAAFLAAVALVVLLASLDTVLRGHVPAAGRIVAAATVALAAWPLGQVLDAREAMALALAAAAFAAARFAEARHEATWAAIALAGLAHAIQVEIGLVALAVLAITLHARPGALPVLLGLSIVRWPWTLQDAASAAGLVGLAAIVGHLGQATLATSALREGAQRVLLTTGLLLPGVALLVGVLLAADPVTLTLWGLGGLVGAVALIGLMTLLATSSSIRAVVLATAVASVVAAVVEGPAALTLLIIPIAALVGIGGAALWVRSFRRAGGPLTRGPYSARSEVNIAPLTKLPPE